jgi:hypothetical protein
MEMQNPERKRYPPLTQAEIRAIYADNPTVGVRRLVWEIYCLHVVVKTAGAVARARGLKDQLIPGKSAVAAHHQGKAALSLQHQEAQSTGVPPRLAGTRQSPIRTNHDKFHIAGPGLALCCASLRSASASNASYDIDANGSALNVQQLQAVRDRPYS